MTSSSDGRGALPSDVLTDGIATVSPALHCVHGQVESESADTGSGSIGATIFPSTTDLIDCQSNAGAIEKRPKGFTNLSRYVICDAIDNCDN